MIESIEPLGVVIDECTVPGETRADDVVPAHPNGIQLSRDRWLVLYASRGFRGLDDDRSIIFQLRLGSPLGAIIKEGCFAQTIDDWQPIDDGKKYVKQFGHPVGFGVPKGALINGKPAPHANVFAATWRVNPRILDPSGKYLMYWDEIQPPPVDCVEWIQFRLNERENDLEIIQPATRLRERGYEAGPAFCRHESAKVMNQSFVQPVPLNTSADEWIAVEHFGHRLAAVRFTFDRALGRYAWTQTGPVLNDGNALGLIEASTLRFGSDFLISGRTPWGDLRLAWMRTSDPFGKPPAMLLNGDIKSDSPQTSYAFPDGVVRVMTGDQSISPYRQLRCPLYMWDIDPAHDLHASNRRVVFDTVAAGLPLPLATNPTIDMAKLLPHGGGREGFILHRVRPDSMNFPSVVTPNVITPEEKRACAIYGVKVVYDQAYEGEWRF